MCVHVAFVSSSCLKDWMCIEMKILVIVCTVLHTCIYILYSGTPLFWTPMVHKCSHFRRRFVLKSMAKINYIIQGCPHFMALD